MPDDWSRLSQEDVDQINRAALQMANHLQGLKSQNQFMAIVVLLGGLVKTRSRDIASARAKLVTFGEALSAQLDQMYAPKGQQ